MYACAALTGSQKIGNLNFSWGIPASVVIQEFTILKRQNIFRYEKLHVSHLALWTRESKVERKQLQDAVSFVYCQVG